ANVTRPEGIVIVGSAPLSPGGGAPATLSEMITAFAPASCAIFPFTANVQTPRSSSTILPASLLTSGVHPLVVDGSATPSSPATTSPVVPAAVSCAPKEAVPNRKLPENPAL